MAYIGYQPSQLATAPFAVNTFTGDGSTTTFTLSQAVPGANEAMVEVVVENVQQNPIDAYTIGGGTNTSLIFSEAPASGAAIYVIHKGEGTYNLQPSTGSVTSASLDPVLRNFTVDTFTGNASATTFTLTDTPYSANSIIVTVDGILQTATTNYTVSGTTLSFGTDAPASGAAITVLHLGFSSGNKSVADGTITTVKLNSAGIAPNITGGTITGATFAAGAVGTPSITTTGDTNTGIYFPAADTIAFTEGGAESMRIDSSGRVVIGTTTAITNSLQTLQFDSGTLNTAITATSYGVNPSISLRAAGGTAASPSATVNNPINFIGGTTSDGTTFFNTIQITGIIESTPSVGSHPTAITFSTTPSGSTSRSERMRIDSSGNVGIATNTPSTYGKFAVVGDGYFSGLLTLGGGQLKFPATQSASADANTLDDYEEGSWTPVMFATGVSGVTYARQIGRYTKVGNVVTIMFTADLSSKGTGGSGQVSITGLPFASASNGVSMLPNYTILVDNLSADLRQIYGQIVANDTTIGLIASGGTTGSHTGLTWANLSNSSVLRCGLTYLVAT